MFFDELITSLFNKSMKIRDFKKRTDDFGNSANSNFAWYLEIIEEIRGKRGKSISSSKSKLGDAMEIIAVENKQQMYHFLQKKCNLPTPRFTSKS